MMNIIVEHLIKGLRKWKEDKENEGLVPTVELLIEELLDEPIEDELF